MSPFIKEEIQRLPGPLQTLHIELVEVNTRPIPISPCEWCRGPVESLKVVLLNLWFNDLQPLVVDPSTFGCNLKVLGLHPSTGGCRSFKASC